MKTKEPTIGAWLQIAKDKWSWTTDLSLILDHDGVTLQAEDSEDPAILARIEAEFGLPGKSFNPKNGEFVKVPEGAVFTTSRSLRLTELKRAPGGLLFRYQWDAHHNQYVWHGNVLLPNYDWHWYFCYGDKKPKQPPKNIGVIGRQLASGYHVFYDPKTWEKRVAKRLETALKRAVADDPRSNQNLLRKKGLATLAADLAEACGGKVAWGGYDGKQSVAAQALPAWICYHDELFGRRATAAILRPLAKAWQEDPKKARSLVRACFKGSETFAFLEERLRCIVRF